jgi:rSAM/selenodomain-associated transferase 1
VTQEHLIIFIKNPIAGKVKTRIAATMGNEMALEIYNILLDLTMVNSLEVNTLRHLYYSDSLEMNDEWANQDFLKAVQVSGNLGHKMKVAFSEIFQQYEDQQKLKVVIIGSDCPELTPDLLSQSFDYLETHDVVLGPTFDGGYYLLGMNGYYPSLFDNINWSTETVFLETVNNTEQLQLTYAILPTLNDIDTESDWVGYQSGIKR